MNTNLNKRKPNNEGRNFNHGWHGFSPIRQGMEPPTMTRIINTNFTTRMNTDEHGFEQKETKKRTDGILNHGSRLVGRTFTDNPEKTD
jgi:hypothetical protein